MICKQCGTEISDSARFCRICGTPVSPASVAEPGRGAMVSQPQPAGSQTQYAGQETGYAGRKPDARSGGFAFLCFCIPVVGLILYLVWRDQYPLKAKSCGKGALIGVIAWPILYIVFYLVLYGVIGAAFRYF